MALMALAEILEFTLQEMYTSSGHGVSCQPPQVVLDGWRNDKIPYLWKLVFGALWKLLSVILHTKGDLRAVYNLAIHLAFYECFLLLESDKCQDPRNNMSELSNL